jgi:hypothetical protein
VDCLFGTFKFNLSSIYNDYDDKELT